MSFEITQILNRTGLPNGAELFRARCITGTVEQWPAIVVFTSKNGQQVGSEYLTADDSNGRELSLTKYRDRLDALLTE